MKTVPTDVSAVATHSHSVAVFGVVEPRRFCVSKLQKKVALFAVLVSVSLAPRAWTQTESGTVVVFGYSKEKVIVAADSRVTFGLEGHDDTQCKVAALGNKVIFATGGVAGLPDGWTPAAEARRAFEAVAPGAWDTGPIANRWAAGAVKRLKAEAAIRPEQLIKHTENNILLIGVFAAAQQDDKISVNVRMLTYSQEGGSIYIGFDSVVFGPNVEMDIQGFGRTEIVDEFVHPVTPRAKREAEQWARESMRFSPDRRDQLRIIRLVDLTLAYHPRSETMHGPIDAVELRRGGQITWIQRKANCAAE